LAARHAVAKACSCRDSTSSSRWATNRERCRGGMATWNR
jgi:hypothetical protein